MTMNVYDDWAVGNEGYLCDDCEDREMYYKAKFEVLQKQLLPLFRHLRGRVELGNEEIDELIDSLTDEVGFNRSQWAMFEREGETK